MNKVVLLFGPTATGKTSLSLALARTFDGEIVSADSMQIYRAMDIGTAKVSAAEQGAVPHHCLDLCDISRSFSAAEYRVAATDAIRAIRARSRLPIVTGGTGLYFDALLYEPSYGHTSADPALRASLADRVNTQGADALYRELQEADPDTAARLHPNDVKRVTRALEIFYSTGKKPSEALTREPNREFEFLSLYLNYENREDLYRACDKRVEEMKNAGLSEEVRALMSCGLEAAPTASQAIGYKELIPFLKGEVSEDAAFDMIKQRTRNYAKRQITWFSKMDAVALPAGTPDAEARAKEAVRNFLKGEAPPC